MIFFKFNSIHGCLDIHTHTRVSCEFIYLFGIIVVVVFSQLFFSFLCTIVIINHRNLTFSYCFLRCRYCCCCCLLLVANFKHVDSTTPTHTDTHSSVKKSQEVFCCCCCFCYILIRFIFFYIGIEKNRKN